MCTQGQNNILHYYVLHVIIHNTIHCENSLCEMLCLRYLLLSSCSSVLEFLTNELLNELIGWGEACCMCEGLTLPPRIEGGGGECCNVDKSLRSIYTCTPILSHDYHIN